MAAADIAGGGGGVKIETDEDWQAEKRCLSLKPPPSAAKPG